VVNKPNNKADVAANFIERFIRMPLCLRRISVASITEPRFELVVKRSFAPQKKCISRATAPRERAPQLESAQRRAEWVSFPDTWSLWRHLVAKLATRRPKCQERHIKLADSKNFAIDRR
jgi:hypothetical protein